MEKYLRHPNILDRGKSVLVVIDMQEPFLRAIHERERLTSNVLILIEAAKILNIPILSTTQYAQRMGGFAPDIAAALGADNGEPIDKFSFSCAGSEEFRGQLNSLGRRQILLCGVETHICIAQTALDLGYAGYDVHVAVDAISSRTFDKHKIGMERIRDSGGLPCATESAVYEWLVAAGTPEFKSILALVK